MKKIKRKVKKMEKEKIDKLIKALMACDTKNPLANCSDCPYEKYDDCTTRLIAACGEYIREHQGAQV